MLVTPDEKAPVASPLQCIFRRFIRRCRCRNKFTYIKRHIKQRRIVVRHFLALDHYDTNTISYIYRIGEVRRSTYVHRIGRIVVFPGYEYNVILSSSGGRTREGGGIMVFRRCCCPGGRSGRRVVHFVDVFCLASQRLAYKTYGLIYQPVQTRANGTYHTVGLQYYGL